MKYRTRKEKEFFMNLQLLAEEDGENAGGDDRDGEEPDEGGNEDTEEKKYSQREMEAAVEKRLARERRKWKRQQEQNADGGTKAGEEPKEESEDSKARKAAEEKAGSLEVKIACYEAGVDKEAVEDVAALARAYMAVDKDLDLEDAIEKVVKKYPHFKNGTEGPKEEEIQAGSWGQRQSGRGAKKMSGVEERFYELNPDLKQ